MHLLSHLQFYVQPCLSVNRSGGLFGDMLAGKGLVVFIESMHFLLVALFLQPRISSGRCVQMGFANPASLSSCSSRKRVPRKCSGESRAMHLTREGNRLFE